MNKHNIEHFLEKWQQAESTMMLANDRALTYVLYLILLELRKLNEKEE